MKCDENSNFDYSKNLVINSGNALEIIEGYFSAIYEQGKSFSPNELLCDLLNQGHYEQEGIEKPIEESVYDEEVEGYCVTCSKPLNTNNGFEFNDYLVYCYDCCPTEIKNINFSTNKALYEKYKNVEIQKTKEIQKQEIKNNSFNDEIKSSLKNIEINEEIFLLILNIIQKQIDLNIITLKDPSWLGKKKVQWIDAIICKSAEGIISSDYKWWENTEVDLLNIEVETINLIHFIISNLLEEKEINNSTLTKLIYLGYTLFKGGEVFSSVEPYNNEIPLDKRKAIIINRFKNIIKLSFTEDINKIPLMFKLIFELLYLSLSFKKCTTDLEYFELVFNKYMTKNILNKFRQANGYKDNFYIKDWDGREDNVVVFEFLNNLENKNMLLKSNTFEDVIYGFMNSTYTYVKNIKRKKEE